MLKWISEADGLPKIGQRVLLAVPRQSGEFWDIYSVQLLVRFEGVVPLPVKAGEQWPTSYWWEKSDNSRSNHVFVTGNSWWASFDEIPLPPGAEHRFINGDHVIAQPSPVWVGQAGDAPKSAEND